MKSGLSEHLFASCEDVISIHASQFVQNWLLIYIVHFYNFNPCGRGSRGRSWPLSSTPRGCLLFRTRFPTRWPQRALAGALRRHKSKDRPNRPGTRPSLHRTSLQSIVKNIVGDPLSTPFLQRPFFTIFAPPKKQTKRASHGFQNEFAKKSLCWKLLSSVLIIFLSNVWSKLILNIQISYVFDKQNCTY